MENLWLPIYSKISEDFKNCSSPMLHDFLQFCRFEKQIISETFFKMYVCSGAMVILDFSCTRNTLEMWYKHLIKTTNSGHEAYMALNKLHSLVQYRHYNDSIVTPPSAPKTTSPNSLVKMA